METELLGIYRLMTLRATALAFVAALAVSPAAADQNDSRLDDLFAQLLKAPDLSTVQPIEADIWRLWYAHEDTAVQILMRRGAEAMGRVDPQSAMKAYDQVVAIAPGFAEGWNRRATLNYDFPKSQGLRNGRDAANVGRCGALFSYVPLILYQRVPLDTFY